jgi:hypothetical protein
VQKQITRPQKESRLLYLPDIETPEAQIYLGDCSVSAGRLIGFRASVGGQGGEKVNGRLGMSLLLSMLKSILEAEADFCAGWLGLGGEWVEAEGGVGKRGGERGGGQGLGVKGRVFSEAFGSLVRQVQDLVEWLLKNDALAAPAIMAHLQAAASDVEEGGGDGGGLGEAVWRKVLSEVQATIRARLVRYVEAQIEVISEGGNASGKKVPGWLRKVPTLVLELISSYNTPHALPPVPKGRDKGVRSGVGEGGGEQGRVGLMEELCKKVCASALRSLDAQASADPKHANRLMLRACHRLISGFQHPKMGVGARRGVVAGEEGGGGGDGTAAVEEMCVQLQTLLEQHKKSYILSALNRVAPRLMKTSENLDRNAAFPANITRAVVLAVVKECVYPPSQKVAKELRQLIMKHLGEDGSVLLAQVWQQLSETLVQRYTVLEQMTSEQFGEKLSPSAQELSAALDAASPVDPRKTGIREASL